MMPACWKCGRVSASAEMRKTSKGHVCKEKRPCDDRRKETKTK